MKKLVSVLTIAATAMFCSSMQAELNFELFNKSPRAITVHVSVGLKYPKRNNYTVQPNSKVQDFINPQEVISILIEDGQLKERFNIKERHHHTATTYLTWNPAKKPYLYPETGPLMGFRGVTESGLSLKNNLKKNDIIYYQ